MSPWSATKREVVRGFFLRILRRLIFFLGSKKIVDYDNDDLQQAIFDTDRALSDWEVVDPDNPCEFENVLRSLPSVPTIDFGGGLGRHSRGLPKPIRQSWGVVEVTSLVKIARIQAHGFEGKFFDNLEAALEEVQESKWIFHSSNALQYSENGMQALERVISRKPSHILLESLLVHDADSEQSFYQYSVLGDNLPSRRLGVFSLRGVRYRVRPLGGTEVEEVLAKNYICKSLRQQATGSFFPRKLKLSYVTACFALKENQ